VIQSGFNLLANGLPALFGLLSFRWLSEILGLENFGTYILLLAAFGVFTQIRAGIISAAFIKMAAGKAEISSLLGASVWISIGVAFFGAVVAIIACFLMNNYFTESFVIIIVTFTSIPSFIAINVNSAQGLFQKVALIRCLEAGVYLLFLLLFTDSNSSIADVLLYFVISSILVSIFILGVQRLPIKFHFSKAVFADIKELWSFGKYTTGTQLVTSLLTNTDIFLINFFLGSYYVALYEFGRKWLEIFEVPFRSLAGVYYTEVSTMMNSGKGKEIWKFITKRAVRTSLICLFFLPMVYVSAPLLIELISGEHNEISIRIFRILSLLVLFIPFDRFLGLSLDVIGFPNLNLFKGFALLATNVVLDIIAIKLGLGITGVAMVSLAFYALGSCLSFYWLRVKSIEINT